MSNYLTHIHESLEAIKKLFKTNDKASEHILNFLNSEIKAKELFLNEIEDYISILEDLKEEYVKENPIESEEKPIEEKPLEKVVQVPFRIGEKTITFKAPSIFDIHANEGEETIENMEYPQETEYPKIPNIKYPPEPLMNKKMNENLINEYFITPEVIFYLRYITHPYKQDLNALDNEYLTYLIEVENYTEEMLHYLMQGTKGESWKYDENYKKEGDDFHGIDVIENYLGMVKDILESWTDRIKLIISNDEISITINPKKTKFNNDVPKSWFNDYMMAWGMIHTITTRSLKKW